MTGISKFSLVSMVLLLTLVAPRLANAFCVYNDKSSDRTVMIAQFEDGKDFKKNTQYLEAFQHGWGKWFVATLKPGGKSCCNWKNKDCNKGNRDTSLLFGAIDQAKAGGAEKLDAQLCYKVIPAGGALVVTAKGGQVSCKERTKYGRGLGYYHQLNSLSWKMRRTVFDQPRAKRRTDKINWNNVFEGGKLANGKQQGVCRGYLGPAGDGGLDMKIVRGIQGKKAGLKNFKGLLLGRLENSVCIGELFGKEVRFNNFEYLTRGTRAKWVKSVGKRASARTAMYAGVDWTGGLMAICRAKYKGAVHAGKQWSNRCYIGVDGKGVGVKAPFEILVSR